MRKSYELKYHNIEENYWWFESRRDIIFKLIQEENKNSKILEIGCSGGPLIRFLKQKGFNNIFGIDVSEDAINLCKERKIKNVFVMDGIKTNFNDKEFDIVIASDILEHIKNDNIALKEWNRILKNNGKLIIFVPAFNFLWSGQDNVSNHYRRYSKSMLIKIIKKANFKIIRHSYWNFILFFPSLIFRLSIRIFLNKKNQKKDQFWALNPLLNNFLIYLLRFENLILKKLKFPIGISIFAVGLKN